MKKWEEIRKEAKENLDHKLANVRPFTAKYVLLAIVAVIVIILACTKFGHWLISFAGVVLIGTTLGIGVKESFKYINSHAGTAINEEPPCDINDEFTDDEEPTADEPADEPADDAEPAPDKGDN